MVESGHLEWRLIAREFYVRGPKFLPGFSPAHPLAAAREVAALGSSPPPEPVNRPGIVVWLGPVPVAARAALGLGSRTGGPVAGRSPSRARPQEGPRQPRSIRCRGRGDDRNIPRIHNSWDSRTLHKVGNRHSLHNCSSRVERHNRSLHRSRRHRRDYISERLRHAIRHHALFRRNHLRYDLLRHDVEQSTRLAKQSVDLQKPRPAY